MIRCQPKTCRWWGHTFLAISDTETRFGSTPCKLVLQHGGRPLTLQAATPHSLQGILFCMPSTICAQPAQAGTHPGSTTGTGGVTRGAWGVVPADSRYWWGMGARMDLWQTAGSKTSSGCPTVLSARRPGPGMLPAWPP